MVREREHKYLLTLNNLIINIATILLMIVLGFFIKWFIVDYVMLDLEVIKIDFINKFGYDFFGFLLYGVRYVLFLFVFLFVYEIIKTFIVGPKKSSFICRIEKGDFYFKCCDDIYKLRTILSLSVPIVLLGVLPIILSLYFKNVYLLILGSITLVFNVRDIIMVIVLLSIGNKVFKYTDYKKRNQFVLTIRKDFNIYRNILVKSIKCIDEDEYVNEDNLFVISRVSILIILLLIVCTVVGVIL